MGHEDLEGLVDLLCRRYEVIDALADEPRSKKELESDLGVSRSTVDRAVRSPEDEDIVVQEGGAVSLTFLGRVTLNGYRQLREGLVGLLEAKSMFETVDTDEPVPFELFRDGDIVTAEFSAPHRPMSAFAQFLDDVREVRSIVKGLQLEGVQAFHRQIVENRINAELVVESSALDVMIAKYGGPLREALTTDRLAIYETDSELPYIINIGESETTEVTVMTTADLAVNGFLRTDNDKAVSWAQGVYDRAKSEATVVAPMD